ncbi:glycosyltransferase [Streptomyces sp. XM4193]|uniref:glycosyltransferase n=1 Tax=Streptomyces sp. XM4193 TaxID=2929782 RepID=UPI001FF735C9|nr:glycosyltransferase [Streptomyces sp. XM4193]MCK1796982.1 glycosyltransferase [Streptomyces sp. XM4193]
MSVHSHSAAHQASAAPEFPQHVVTAVLVAHDGERWLPDALAGLVGQIRPAQDVVAADTGSADSSAQLLADTLGTDRVLHLARRSGFGTAVDEAVRTAAPLTPDQLTYLKRPSGWDPVSRTWRDEAYDMPELPYGEPVQWLWLLHDDCAPEPDALLELLKVADATPSAGIIGTKLRSWYNNRQLLETGVSIANSGRRWTGLDRREQDQGQHDQVRQVLSVSTAGMLIRRDLFEELGGFDRRLPLMRDDVDLCWRAQNAGHQVLVAPAAVLRHAEASARERRPIDCAGRTVVGPHRVDKAGAVYTLLANAPGRTLPWVLLRLVVGTLLRTLAYLVGKVPGQAVDEVTGLVKTLLRPGLIVSARRKRGRPVVERGELRPLFPPPGATVRATVEQVAANFSGRSDPDQSAGGRHGAVESGPGGDDADFLEVEQFARIKRVVRRPAPVLFAALLLVSLVACRGLLTGGALSGGALLPAPGDAADLWQRYVGAWHPVGVGSTETAPPYLAILAGMATLLLGSTGLTMTLLLVGSVPLAGVCAYFASRGLVASGVLRAWASVAYAFLPAATGALAAGRLGTAVLAVVLPLLARTGVRAAEGRGWRPVWLFALLLTVTTAFTPVSWPIAFVLVVGVLVWRLRQGGGATGLIARAAAALLTPIVVLAPWSTALFADPSRFFAEAGLAFDNGSAAALDLVLLDPGGPGTAGSFLLVGVVLAALAALLREERQWHIRAAWAVALTGFLFAALTGDSGWAGPSTLVYGLGLIAAAVLGAEGVRTRVASQSFGWRQPVAALIGVTAVAAPLVGGLGWMVSGAGDPLGRGSTVQVPAFVAEESATRDRPRTLVLSGQSDGEVSYSLVRGSGARLGDGDLARTADGDSGLDAMVANLVAGSGADQTERLRGYGVRYVLVRGGEAGESETVGVLNATPGLERLSQQSGGQLWRVESTVARLMIVAEGADPVPVAAGPVDARAKIPAGSGKRTLRLADAESPGWTATLDGTALTATTVDGWAQGFELPAEGGTLELTHESPATRTGWVWAQCGLAVLVVILALPGRRREHDDDLPEAEAAALPQQSAEAGTGRRARRLAATAPASPAGGADGPVPPPAPAAAPEPDGQQAGGPPDAPAGPYRDTAPHPDAQPYAADPPYPDSGPYPDAPAPDTQPYPDAPAGPPYPGDPYAPQSPYAQAPHDPPATDPYGPGPQGDSARGGHGHPHPPAPAAEPGAHWNQGGPYDNRSEQ